MMVVMLVASAMIGVVVTGISQVVDGVYAMSRAKREKLTKATRFLNQHEVLSIFLGFSVIRLDSHSLFLCLGRNRGSLWVGTWLCRDSPPCKR